MRNSLETRLGIFVALAVIATVLILEMVGGFQRYWGGHTYYAMFKNVEELKVGDRVKMAGVEIGRVENIQLTNANVMVTMKVGRKAAVRTDSTASIKFTGLMGQNFISLDFGTPGAPIADTGALLATTEQPDFNAIMTKLDSVATGVENLTKSFTGDKIDNLLGPFTDFLTANKQPLTTTISNMAAVSSQIAQGQGTVGKLIYEQALYDSALSTVSNLYSAADQIKSTVGDAHKVIDQVNSGQGTIGKLLTDSTLYNETTASMTNLHSILSKINGGEGTVGKLINDQEFYKNAKLSLQKLDKATEGLEDQGPLSVLGIAVSSLL